MRTISPSQAKSFTVQALMDQLVPYLSGPPGIGKSDIAKEVADEFSLKLIDVRLTQKLPEDMTGMPSLQEDKRKAEYVPFDTFPMEGDEIPEDYEGWLVFLDELSSASEEILAASYSLILDHMIGGRKLHPKARIMAAGNHSTDSAIARPLPDTIITRVLPVVIKPNVKDWLSWADRIGNKGNDHTKSFIKKYPEMLLDTSPPDQRGELEPYCNPRAWGRVMTLVNRFEKLRKPAAPREDIPGISVPEESETFQSQEPINEVTSILIEAAIGSIAARSYIEDYNESLALPNPWDCAISPSSTVIPPTGAGKATLTNSLAKYFPTCGEEARGNVLTYMNRMPSEYRSLFSMTMEDSLGSTASDIKLLDSINKRLSVEELDIGDVIANLN